MKLDKELDDATHGFKGTKDEWALYYMEYHMIPTAKDYDNVSEESAMKRVLAEIKKLKEEKAGLVVALTHYQSESDGWGEENNAYGKSILTIDSDTADEALNKLNGGSDG